MGSTENYDISDIGQVTFRLDFDEDDYADYLAFFNIKGDIVKRKEPLVFTVSGIGTDFAVRILFTLAAGNKGLNIAFERAAAYSA